MSIRVQHFCDASGSDSAACEGALQGLGGLFSNGPDFGFFGAFVCLAFVGSAESLESMWTIPLGAVLWFGVPGMDCPHPILLLHLNHDIAFPSPTLTRGPTIGLRMVFTVNDGAHEVYALSITYGSADPISLARSRY